MRNLLLAICVLLLAACSSAPAPKPVHTNPPLHLVVDEWTAWGAAAQDAWERGADENTGGAYKMLPTGSMEPALQAGDYVSVVPTAFADYKVGDIILYDADWAPEGEPLVIHRIVGIDARGLIMQGDAVPHFSEAAWRVTAQTAKGRIEGIWRYPLQQ